MTAAVHLQAGARVLEIGTGCGYQAAVLSRLAREVFSIERRPELASGAATKLTQLGYSNAHVHCGDGTLGLAELAPFNAILVAAAAPAVPKPLLAQLAEGGRLILPVGGAEHQELQLIKSAVMLSPPGCWKAADLCLLSATMGGRNLPDDERSSFRPLHHHSLLQRRIAPSRNARADCGIPCDRWAQRRSFGGGRRLEGWHCRGGRIFLHQDSHAARGFE